MKSKLETIDAAASPFMAIKHLMRLLDEDTHNGILFHTQTYIHGHIYRYGTITTLLKKTTGSKILAAIIRRFFLLFHLMRSVASGSNR